MKCKLIKIIFVTVLALSMFTMAASAEETQAWKTSPTYEHSYDETENMLVTSFYNDGYWPAGANCYRDLLVNAEVYDAMAASSWGTTEFVVTFSTPYQTNGWEMDAYTYEFIGDDAYEASAWFAEYVWKCTNAYIQDHPERPDLQYQSMSGNFDFSYIDNGSTITVTSINQVRVTITKSVTSGYSRTTFNNAISSARAILEDDNGPYNVDSPELLMHEKVDVINDYLCNNISYDHSSDWSYHQSCYTALVDGWSVCAGYSRSLKLFCDIYGIPCVWLQGYAYEESDDRAHAWNYIKMDDGKWYAIDVTWNDMDDGSTEQSNDMYSLVGFETVIYGDAYGVSHLPKDDLLLQPALSEEAYDPTSIDGLIQLSDGTWRYYVDGEFASNYTGPVEYYGASYYVTNGQIIWGLNGLHYANDGIWYYLVDSIVQTSYTGLVEYYGGWYYVENGVLNWNYTGLTYYGAWYYVENGVLNWGYTGLACYYDVWYYVESGIVNWNYVGLTYYGGVWYYVADGILDSSYTGLTYYGAWYYVENGVLNWDYTGLTCYGGGWYYVENGVLNWNYTGLTFYCGVWFYVGNGVLDSSYIGLTNYCGYWYYVAGGVVDWGYTGYATTPDGTEYYVVSGVAQV